MSAGVLNQQQIRELFSSAIKSANHISAEPDPSSIDIPLSDKYYVMKASCRPHSSCVVKDLIQHHRIKEERIEDNTVFEPNKVYLVKADWDLELPDLVCARATARSSIGRLDVLVRLVTDHAREFDRASQGQSTALYVEVVPITFPIRVEAGKALSQLRFMKGDELLCTVGPKALACEEVPVLVHDSGERVELEAAAGDGNAILLSLNLEPDPELSLVGFVAKSACTGLGPVNPWARKDEETGKDDRHDPKEFWEPIHAENKNGQEKTVLIKKNRFYLFRSKERFRLPAHLAVDAHAYSESLGDIRIHYAGFAHPYFGFDRKEGTPLIFEVRGHNMDTILRDGDALAKLYFRRMSKPAATPGDENPQEYNDQELKLSGCFKEWPH